MSHADYMELLKSPSSINHKSQSIDYPEIEVKQSNNCWKITKALLQNPLLLSVLIGASVNLLCHAIGQKMLPLFFQNLLKMISSPFDFLALLLMGIGMSGKIHIDTFFGRKVCFLYDAY